MNTNRLLRRNQTEIGMSALVILLACLLTGCTSEDRGGGGGSGGASVEDGCVAQWPKRLSTQSEDEEEKTYFHSTPACSSADGTERILINNSDAVWYFTVDSGTGFSTVDSEEGATSFREFVDYNLHPEYEYIAPTETRLIPTGRVEYHIDRALTKTWLAHDIYLTTISAYSKAASKRAFTNGSKSKQAVFDCTLAFWTVARTDQLSTTPVESEQQVLDLLGIAASSGSCANSWRAAELEAGHQRFPTWSENVAKAGTIADNMTKVHTGWGWVRTFCAGVPRFC